VEPLTVREAAAAVGGLLLGDPDGHILRVTTDSRDVRRGDLFVCLRGARHDSHDFAADVLAAGAAAVLADRELPALRPQILAGSGPSALGALAGHTRRALAGAAGPLVVGITGSNGKTTTKDLVAAALAPRGPVVASERSFNNELGVPFTLLRADRGTRSVVVEIGTNAPGEIAALAAIARPHIAVITNIQPAHLAGLGSVEGVRREKGALLAALEGPRVAVLNCDEPSFDALAASARGPVLSFGFGEAADVRATQVECRAEGTRFRLDGRRSVSLRLLGRHAAANALAALAVARAAGVDEDAAIAALARVASPPGRLALRRVGALTLVDDTYNANPGSFAAALAALAEARLPGRLVVVAGEMLELGEASPALHRAAGRQVAEAGAMLLVAVGSHARDVVSGAVARGLPAGAAHACDDREEAEACLRAALRPGDVVLLKGSRGARLEALVDRLAEGRGTAA
jgi:UDP-N-acetylmuramoyl-tripeptide--D-alanyl-D-alanine ligase